MKTHIDFCFSLFCVLFLLVCTQIPGIFSATGSFEGAFKIARLQRTQIKFDYIFQNDSIAGRVRWDDHTTNRIHFGYEFVRIAVCQWPWQNSCRLSDGCNDVAWLCTEHIPCIRWFDANDSASIGWMIYAACPLCSAECNSSRTDFWYIIIFVSIHFNWFLIIVDITKGDVISTTYGQALQSTMQRRIHLRQSKLFDCMCQRCRDPSECDTFIGSMVCPRCTSSKLVSNDPLVSSADWMCASCSFQMDSGNYQLISNRLQFAIENIPKHSPYDFELFLEKYCHPEKQMAANSNGVSLESRTEALLHEKNTFVLQIKYALTQLYGNVTGFKWDGMCDCIKYSYMAKENNICFTILIYRLDFNIIQNFIL